MSPHKQNFRTSNQPRKSRRRAREHTDKYADRDKQPPTLGQSDAPGDLILFRPYFFHRETHNQIRAVQKKLGEIAAGIGVEASRVSKPRFTVLGPDAFARIRGMKNGSYDPENETTFKRPLHAAICSSIGRTAVHQLQTGCQGLVFKETAKEAQLIALLAFEAVDEIRKAHDAVNKICGQEILSESSIARYVQLGSVPRAAYAAADFAPVASMPLKAFTFAPMQTTPGYAPIQPPTP